MTKFIVEKTDEVWVLYSFDVYALKKDVDSDGKSENYYKGYLDLLENDLNPERKRLRRGLK